MQKGIITKLILRHYTLLFLTLLPLITSINGHGTTVTPAKKITQIHIHQLPAIAANTPRAIKRKRFVRWLSPTTSEKLILSYLPPIGEVVTNQAIIQFQKRLSQLPYFSKVTITQKTHQGDQKKINLIVHTQDAFPLTAHINLDQGLLGTIVHNNVLGKGHQLYHQFFFKKKLGYGLQYSIPTHKGIMTTGGQLYTHHGNEYIYQYSYKNAWIKKDFNSGTWHELYNKTLHLGGRYTHKFFSRRPLTTKSKNKWYHHHHFILAELGTKGEAYYINQQVYGLGELEKIPCGSNFSITGGYQLGEYYNRTYLGINLSKGGKISFLGHFYGHISCGGFLQQHKIEQGALQIDVRYFTPLFKTNFQHFRHFINATYLTGYNRLSGEGLGIDMAQDPDEMNEKWAENPCPKGHTRIAIDLESIWFIPRLYNLKLGLLGFVEMVALQNTNNELLNKNIYNKMGMGIRLQHKKLPFLDNLYIKVGYSPIRKEAMDIQIGITTSPLHDWKGREPDVVPYY